MSAYSDAAFHAETIAFAALAFYAEGALVGILGGSGYEAGMAVKTKDGNVVSFYYRNGTATSNSRWTRLDWEYIPGVTLPERGEIGRGYTRPTAKAGKRLLTWMRKVLAETDVYVAKVRAYARRERDRRNAASAKVSEATGLPTGSLFALTLAGEPILLHGRNEHAVDNGFVHLDLGLLSGDRLVRVMSALRAAGVLEVTEVVADDADEAAS